MKRIVLAYFNAGGGHRAAARALHDTMHAQGRPWCTTILDVDQVLESIDPIYRSTGVRGGELYNWTLRRGWTVGSAHVIPIMHGVIRLLHSRQVKLLREQWRALRPDLVVSVIPHLNRALYESLRAELPDTPFVTLITDLADYPPHFWFEPQDQHFICGSDIAVEQARAAGIEKRNIWQVSGMILHPHFYQEMPGNRAEERRKLGLDPALPVGLVLFGGYGSQSMVRIARRLATARTKTQLIFLCGRNCALADQLRAMTFPFPVHVQGFTEHVAHYMWLSEFFIGKPGPGSVSEALAMGLPVIVEAGSKTLAQERYNVEWIREQGVGLPVARTKDFPHAVNSILKPTNYHAISERIRALNNRAVFEVPDVLESILSQAQAASSQRSLIS
ncbi:MAG TPA: glycosyltransferase [Bryobacteraceae bacterium]|nr:glycosyltransferase [Bryobacteraceae bacterium]